uniref:eIF-4F 25 kDa subunit n=1 Tax=Physcomitrium patens TaxID=3218 RepID=A0A7I4BWP5_PHYPA
MRHLGRKSTRWSIHGRFGSITRMGSRSRRHGVALSVPCIRSIPSKIFGDFHCFKAGIEPKWEDPKCAHGGKWTAQPPRSGGKAALDTYWLHTLLAMIGEQFDESEEICGAVVSVRRAQDKIAIWTKTASNEAAQVTIGKQWKDIIDCNDKLGYLVHEDAKRQEKGAKNRYTV